VQLVAESEQTEQPSQSIQRSLSKNYPNRQVGSVKSGRSKLGLNLRPSISGRLIA
jgi:hypothetical protein